MPGGGFLLKRRRPYLKVVAVAASVMTLLVFLIIIDHMLRDVFYDLAEIKATQLATEAIQNSILQEAANENIQYQDLVIVHKDEQGRVAMMQANTLKVNRIAASTVMAAQKNLDDLKRKSFSIPVGQIIDLPLFANFGPRIKYNMMPVGTVRFSISDRFDTAGINQTRHTIYLNLDTKVRVVIPSKTGEVSVSTQVPLTENIIVGDIPNTFVSVPGGIFGSGAIK
ncbi:MAG: Sporulation protein YunB [Pelotomaculum sp. PtaB.Bin104]|nr:MAG: Sporulation protein YunB [Pelotomaculum sp. PtaB.Bin104]